MSLYVVIMAKLVSEAQANFEFFSPVKYSEPNILVRQGLMIEIFAVSSSREIIKKVQYKESNTIYDYLWAGSSEFYLSLIKDHPISLRRTSTTKLIQKYPIYNHLCEIKSPYTACSYDNTRFLTTLGNTVYEYDIETAKSSKKVISQEILRQRTVINAICCNKNLVFLGSFNRLVYIIDNRSRKILSALDGQEGGVIQCITQGNYLYVGGRKDSHVLLWDLRNPSLPVNLFSFPRTHNSFQKILFDVNTNSDLLVGNNDGTIVKYNSSGEELKNFYGHFDAVNSVQFSPAGIISSSGQRHYESRSLPSLIRIFDE